jgi:hypothetical protein
MYYVRCEVTRLMTRGVDKIMHITFKLLFLIWDGLLAWDLV